MEVSLIQLLGRWSSSAVERYTQQAALSIVPQVPFQVLSGAPPHQRQTVPQAFVNPASGLVTPGVVAPATPARVTQPKDPNDTKVQQLQQQLEDLKLSVATLKAVIKPPDQVLLVRPRRHVVHKGIVDEQSNNPHLWKTQCGWAYGASSFFRVQHVVAPFRHCARCFHDVEAVSSDDASGGESSSSASTGSHSSD